MTTVPINIQDRIHTKPVRLAVVLGDLFSYNSNLKHYDFRGVFPQNGVAYNIYIHTNSWHKGNIFSKDSQC